MPTTRKRSIRRRTQRNRGISCNRNADLQIIDQLLSIQGIGPSIIQRKSRRIQPIQHSTLQYLPESIQTVYNSTAQRLYQSRPPGSRTPLGRRSSRVYSQEDLLTRLGQIGSLQYSLSLLGRYSSYITILLQRGLSNLVYSPRPLKTLQQ